MKIGFFFYSLALLFSVPIFADEAKGHPERLRLLLESYEREKARVLEPVERKLDAALFDLQQQYTKAGRLDDALAVSEIIQKRSPEEPEPSWLANTKWKWGSGGRLELNSDGTATHTSWETPGSWKEQEDGSVTLISEYNVSTIVFEDQTSGTVSTKTGGSTTLTLIK